MPLTRRQTEQGKKEKQEKQEPIAKAPEKVVSEVDKKKKVC